MVTPQEKDDLQPQASPEGKQQTTNSLSVRSSVLIRDLFFLQSLILQIALNWIEQEKTEAVAAKEAYMAETCPAPDMSGDANALMVSRAWTCQTD